MSTAKMPYVLTDTFVSVVLPKPFNGERTFALDQSHPTFKRLVSALKRNAWAQVPKLVTLASQLANQRYRDITVSKDGVFYKKQPVDTVLAQKIAALVREGKPTAPYLKFMWNLYQNPSVDAQGELFEWLQNFNNGKFVPTDDGCFLAYKAVRDNYRDVYSNTWDYRVGQIARLSRDQVDPDRRNECSYGLHFCSLGYLHCFGGQKIMKIKVNPRDVVAIPRDYGFSKGRTCCFEVLAELADKNETTSRTEFLTEVIAPIATERKEMLKQLLAIPRIKRLIRDRKLSEKNVRKLTYGRLAQLLDKFGPKAPRIESKLFQNPLKAAREAAGFSRGEVAAELDITYKAVYLAETAKEPSTETIDMYMKAISRLTEFKLKGSAGVTYPVPRKREYAMTAAAGVGVGGDAYTTDAASSVADEEVETDEYGYEEEEIGVEEEE
jgi:hypothetical protein